MDIQTIGVIGISAIGVTAMMSIPIMIYIGREHGSINAGGNALVGLGCAIFVTVITMAS